MSKTHPPYAPEFRRQVVELVRSCRSAGRSRFDLTGGSTLVAEGSSISMNATNSARNAFKVVRSWPCRNWETDSAPRALPWQPPSNAGMVL